MNHIAAAAVLLPAVSGAARKVKVNPSRLLMPLAFATILGGIATLFTTKDKTKRKRKRKRKKKGRKRKRKGRKRKRKGRKIKIIEGKKKEQERSKVKEKCP